MQEEQEESVGFSKFGSNAPIVYLILFVLSIVCAFFPFRIETVQGGMQSGLFGNSFYVSPSRESLDAFDLPVVFIEHGILVIAALLLIISDKKAYRIIGLIFSVLAGLFMFVLYAGLNFQLNLFGRATTIEIGNGYYFLLLIYIVFLFYSVLLFRRKQESNVRKRHAAELLDDPFSE